MEKRPTVPGKPAEPGKKSEPESQSLIEIEFPRKITPFVMLAMATGSALAIASLAGPAFIDMPSAAKSVAMGAGIAIILAAFGGQATVRGRTFVFAGVAGIAAALIWFLDWSEQKHVTEKSRSYAQGWIGGVPVGKYKVSLKFGTRALGYHSSENKQFQFVAFKSQILGKVATVEILGGDNPDTSEFNDLIIESACFEPWIGREEPIDWSYDAVRNVIVENGTSRAIGARLGQPTEPCMTDIEVSAAARQAPRLAHAAWMTSTAFAEEQQQQIGPLVEQKFSPLTEAEIDQAFTDLSSDDSDVRRGARDILSSATPENIPQIMERLRRSQNIGAYRIRLGVSVALAEMLRRDKSQAERIKLEPADIDILLEFASAGDRTLRVYAAEFLFDLAYPEVTKKALERAARVSTDSSFDEARYSLLFLSQSGWLKLSSEQQFGLKVFIDEIRLNSAGKSKTLELLAKFS